MQLDPAFVGVFVALGVGLLIGIDRELRKGAGRARRAAGVRTFVLVALAGAAARLLGGDLVLALTIAGVTALACASYLRSRNEHPGLTSEVALVATALLGALAVDRPTLAAALGVLASITLAVRSPLHRFIRQGLTRQEMSDGLVFAALTFVVWPLLPDRPIGPFNAVNPHKVWLVAILAMGAAALGHVAMRLIGPRLGLAISGFVSGFISSAVTIGAMGARATQTPHLLSAAASGAVLSTVATIVQLALLVMVVSPDVARAMAGSLACAGLAAIGYATLFVLRPANTPPEPAQSAGHAFNLRSILTFTFVLCVVLIVSAALSAGFGAQGVQLAAGVAGLVDLHAAAVSVSSLNAGGQESVPDSVVAILIALSTNTLTKMVLAFSSGGAPFARRVAPGLLLVAGAAWAGLLVRI